MSSVELPVVDDRLLATEVPVKLSYYSWNEVFAKILKSIDDCINNLMLLLLLLYFLF